MNDSVTYKEVYELVEKLRTEILTELRLQRAEHIQPLTEWQRQHEEFHRNERRGAWRAVSVVATLCLGLGGLVLEIIHRATS
jgi:hypothetical protein